MMFQTNIQFSGSPCKCDRSFMCNIDLLKSNLTVKRFDPVQNGKDKKCEIQVAAKKWL